MMNDIMALVLIIVLPVIAVLQFVTIRNYRKAISDITLTCYSLGVMLKNHPKEMDFVIKKLEELGEI